jgi:hypothetical protein
MQSLSSVFMCFHCVFTAETWTFGTFHMYTKIHMFYVFYMKCKVLPVFSCFFTVFFFTAETWTFGTFQMNTKIHMYHIFYMKKTVLLVFSCDFTVFSLCFHCRNMYFWYISHVYQNTQTPYILHEMHSFARVFMWFHCVIRAEICTFGTFHMYTKIHMYHIFYMKSTVLLVLSCVFTVFSLQKHVLLVHFTCIPKYTCTIYSTWNAQFC